MTAPISPYLKPGFYDDALARGRHRDIVGGRWDETGRAQMAALLAEGLEPHHILLDIGAGSLRLGCKAVAFLDPGHYWATDQSRALMLAGHAREVPDPSRLNPNHLIEDADFSFPGLPDTVSHAMAFAVFTHLPHAHLHRALTRIHACFPRLQCLLFTLFLAPEGTPSLRQPDGVVTHAHRAPYHVDFDLVQRTARATGFTLSQRPTRLPRGQVLFVAHRAEIAPAAAKPDDETGQTG